MIVALRQGAQDIVNPVGQEMTKRNMSIQPTLTIRPECPMRVMVSKDLVLRHYRLLFFVKSSQRATLPKSTHQTPARPTFNIFFVYRNHHSVLAALFAIK